VEKDYGQSLGSGSSQAEIPKFRECAPDRRLARVVVGTNRATLSKEVEPLDPDTALLRTIPRLGLPQPGFLLWGSMSNAQE
jgi:hypothetical protein